MQARAKTTDSAASAGSPGEVLFEFGPRHTMLVKNEGAVDATLYATFIVPVGAAPLTVTTEHLCGIDR